MMGNAPPPNGPMNGHSAAASLAFGALCFLWNKPRLAELNGKEAAAVRVRAEPQGGGPKQLWTQPRLIWQKVNPELLPDRSRQDDPNRPLLFCRADSSLYVNLATLPQKAGVPASMLPLLVVKEFGDNALDACDAAGRPGAVDISVDSGNLIVTDQGTGIADATPERIAGLFCVARPMVSTKLLRRPTRGCVGNGLRACLGYLTATRGRLIVETGTLRVELVPEIDGSSRIVRSSTIEPRQGLRLTAIAGDAPFATEHLSWAEDAVELARQSGAPAFTDDPSAHWLDLDYFRVALRAAVGNVSVRRFLNDLAGCKGSLLQSKIAAKFLRRSAVSLDEAEAAELLAAAQAATEPPKPEKLCPLGKDAVVSGGYGTAKGMFTEGIHEPRQNPVPGRVLGGRFPIGCGGRGTARSLHEPCSGHSSMHLQRLAWTARGVGQRH